MNIRDLLNSIKNNDLTSNYLLFGEEFFFIDKIDTLFLEKIIPEDEKLFNQKIFYGKETNVFSLISSLKSFPIVGERQLIILREAQQMDKIDQLDSYLKSPSLTTIFVVCYKKKKVDGRKKWVKLFKDFGVLFESKKLYGQRFSKWVHHNLLEKNIRIDRDAEMLLVDFLGNNLSKISNALTKLSTIISDGVITISDIENHIGVNREYNNFELQNALAEKNNKKVILIAEHFIANPNKFYLPLTTGVLFSFFSKLLIIHSLENHSAKNIAEKIKVPDWGVPVYKLGYKNYSFTDCIRIISLLKELDLKFKGISGNSNIHSLKESLLRIIY